MFASSAKSGERHPRSPRQPNRVRQLCEIWQVFPGFRHCPTPTALIQAKNFLHSIFDLAKRHASRVGLPAPPAPYVETLQKLATSNHPKQHASRKVANGRFLLPRKLFSRHLPLDCSRHLNSITLWSIGARGPHCRCRKRQLRGARNRPERCFRESHQIDGCATTEPRPHQSRDALSE